MPVTLWRASCGNRAGFQCGAGDSAWPELMTELCWAWSQTWVCPWVGFAVPPGQTDSRAREQGLNRLLLFFPYSNMATKWLPNILRGRGGKANNVPAMAGACLVYNPNMISSSRFGKETRGNLPRLWPPRRRLHYVPFADWVGQLTAVLRNHPEPSH